MKIQIYEQNTAKDEVAAIVTLLAASVIIVLLGSIFSIVSLIHHISFPVMRTHVHGSLFGVPLIYLGCRYFSAFRELNK